MSVHEGGCLCTVIRYRITGTAAYSVVCHCPSCRRAAGAAAVAWITVARPEFRFVSGFPAAYQSSPGVVRRFCGACSSSLTYENSARPDTVDVTTATLDAPDEFAPRQEVWLEHRIAWQPTDPALARFPRGMS